MRTLYHLWLSPFCRKVRIALTEKGLDFAMKAENPRQRRRDFLVLNPAGELPVLVEDDDSVIADSTVICEYLEETYPDVALISGDARQRAEVRRLVAWFDLKFDREVTRHLVGEKVLKRFLGGGTPDSRAIRAGAENIHTHLEYIAWLARRRDWLAGSKYSLADIAAAAHLSCVDYSGDVPWDAHPDAKTWYLRVKSRRAFRPLLADRIAGEPPPRHYALLKF